MDFELIPDILTRNSSLYGDLPALRIMNARGEYEMLSFRELRELSLATARKLAALGVSAGDRVALTGPNGPDWVVGAFAVLSAGAVMVPLDQKSTSGELEAILTASGTRFLILTGESRVPEIAETGRGGLTMLRLRGSCSTARSGSKPGSAAGDPGPKREDDRAGGRSRGPAGHAGQAGQTGPIELLRDTTSASPPPGRLPRRKSDDLALLVYTSGTTGAPKGVMLSHGNILSDLRGFSRRIPIQEKSRFLSLLPLSHMFEFNAGMLYPLSRGCSITYLRSLTGSEIMLNFRKGAPVNVICVPRLLQLLKNRIARRLESLPGWKRILLSVLSPVCVRSKRFARILYADLHRTFGGRLELFVVGGAPIHPEVIMFFDRLGFTVLQGYGLTETSPVLTATSPSDNRIGTVGRPVEGAVIRIAGKKGLPGEIQVRGPMVTSGYFGNDEATRAAFEDGWFRTGDIGYLDETGSLVVCGRSKALIVTAAGKNVYPEEVESVLGRSPLVKEICVVASRRADGGERPYAFIVPDSEALSELLGSDPDEGDVRSAIQRELSRLGRELSEFKRLSGWELHEGELPKTATQKIRRFELQKRLDERGDGRTW